MKQTLAPLLLTSVLSLGLAGACSSECDGDCGGSVASTTSATTTTASSASTSSGGASGSTATTTTSATSSGGASSGTGGASASSGGSGSTGGATSSSSGNMEAKAECATDADCQLVDDCCDCLGLPASEPAPACSLDNCFVLTCQAASFSGPAVCRAGHCAAGFDCHQGDATCGTTPPLCANGKLATVGSGGCWGGCEPPDQCAHVDACSLCTADEVCVSVGGGVQESYCVPIAKECGGAASCACMGKAVCGGSVPCSDTTGDLVCQTP